MTAQQTAALLCLSFLLSFLSGCTDDIREVSPPPPYENTIEYPLQRREGHLDCIMFRVGAADAMLFASMHHTVLLDTGEADDEDAAKILAYLAAEDITRLDAVILSNHLPDNIGGLSAIADAVTIDAIYHPSSPITDKRLKKFLRTAVLSGAELTEVKKPLTLTFDDVTMTLSPAAHPAFMQTEEDFSLVTAVTHKANTLLLTSDIGDARMQDLVGNLKEPYTAVKLPQHGAWFSEAESFLNQTAPLYALISDSEAQEASYEMLSMLADRNIFCYRTKDAHVCIHSDGIRLSFSQQ